jgi:hypothetical protein
MYKYQKNIVYKIKNRKYIIHILKDGISFRGICKYKKITDDQYR